MPLKARTPVRSPSGAVRGSLPASSPGGLMLIRNQCRKPLPTSLLPAGPSLLPLVHPLSLKDEQGLALDQKRIWSSSARIDVARSTVPC